MTCLWLRLLMLTTLIGFGNACVKALINDGYRYDGLLVQVTEATPQPLNCGVKGRSSDYGRYEQYPKNYDPSTGAYLSGNGHLGHYPWLSRVIGSYCGGVIISQKIILTSVYCIAYYIQSMNYPLTSVTLLDSTVTPPYQKADVDCINYYKSGHDIAIIRLLRNLTVNSVPSAVCLPTKELCGNQSFYDSFSETVLWNKMDQYLYNRYRNGECSSTNGKNIECNRKNFICSDPDIAAGGWPLTVEYQGNQFLWGISNMSYLPCQQFTNICYYLPWIEDNIKKDSSETRCIKF